MTAQPTLSERLSCALDHYRFGDWTLAKWDLREAVDDAMARACLREDHSPRSTRPPGPAVAAELRLLATALAALADAIDGPARAPDSPG